MKFRIFKQNKLWRDKAVERMVQMGSKIHWRQLNDEEFLEQLKLKFMEEAQEVVSAQSRPEMIGELADILEVINSLCDVHRFSFQDILEAQKKKHQERGGFEGRRFVNTAEHQVGSFGERYCLADPEKYPEIVE